MRVGSLHGPAKNDTPSGNAPRAYPAGTVRSGHPDTAPGLDEPANPVKSSPVCRLVSQEALFVGAMIASRWSAASAALIALRDAVVAVRRCCTYVGSVRLPLVA